MVLLIATIGLFILVMLNRSVIRSIKGFRMYANARSFTEVVTYKISKLKANLDNCKKL
jgi:uncharacterized protein YebE (UPF0316 family)